MTYRCGSPVPGRAAVLSEKETCSYLYIFVHDPSLPAITNSSPKSNELLERLGPGLQHFLLLPNSGLIKPDHPTRSLTTAPVPWGPFGAVSAMGDARTRLGRCNREGKKRGQRRGHGSDNRILCPVPQARRARRNSNPPERYVLPSTSAAASPGDTRSGREIPVPQGQIQSWLSRKTGTKAELPNKTEQGRPNATGVGLLPVPEVLLSLPWGRGGGEAAMTKSRTRSSALRHDGKCSFFLFDFTCLARTPIGSVNLRSKAGEATSPSSPVHRWSSFPISRLRNLSTP